MTPPPPRVGAPVPSERGRTCARRRARAGTAGGGAKPRAAVRRFRLLRPGGCSRRGSARSAPRHVSRGAPPVRGARGTPVASLWCGRCLRGLPAALGSGSDSGAPGTGRQLRVSPSVIPSLVLPRSLSPPCTTGLTRDP